MYPDESCQSLVYCLRSQNMFGWYIKCLDYVIACDYLMNCFTLAYPICLSGCLVCGSSLLRWSSIYWWEHMWEVLAVNRGTVTPLLSHLGWILFSRFSFKATAHVLAVLKIPNLLTVEYLYLVRFSIVGCLGLYGVVFKLQDCISVLSCVTLPLIMFII